MKVLLDTPIFIWWAFESNKLPPQGRAIAADPGNTVGLSVVSLWEMQIKMQLGKLALPLSLADVVATQQKTNALFISPINSDHVLALQGLPMPHNTTTLGRQDELRRRRRVRLRWERWALWF